MDAPFRPPLRGREQELAVIRRKLSQVRAGTGCVVVVEGSAGLGKTRLLDECVSMAGELSFRVGRGAAEPGRVIELGALFDALFEGDPPLADRRALNDVHASSEFLFWLLQDVQSLIEEAALKNPVLICLDDLHWGGTSFSLATFAAGLGRRFSIHDLAAMTDMSLTELINPVNELVQADIFADDGGRLAFRHDIIREAVRGSLLPPVRRAVDRQAADVLLAHGALPVEVATQLVESAEPGDDVAIETALKATQILGASDPAAAAELAAKTLDLTPLRHPLRSPLVAQRVVSLFAAGLAEEGKRFADSALRQAMPSEEEARVRISVASMFDLSPEIRSEKLTLGSLSRLCPRICVLNCGLRCTTASAWPDANRRRSPSSRVPARPRREHERGVPVRV